MRVIVMTCEIHFHPQICKNVVFEKNLMSIGGCNMRENKTKPGINGLIRATLPRGANFTE